MNLHSQTTITITLSKEEALQLIQYLDSVRKPCSSLYRAPQVVQDLEIALTDELMEVVR